MEYIAIIIIILFFIFRSLLKRNNKKQERPYYHYDRYYDNNTTNFSCLEPGCNGKLVVRSSKYGNNFYGCSNFPECTFTIFDQIVNLGFPGCGADFLTTINPNAQGILVYNCATPFCGFKATSEDYYI